MSKIAVLGSAEMLRPFLGSGLDTIPLESQAQARRAFSALLGQDYSVLFLEESWLESLREEVERCWRQTLPAVVLLPGASGGHGMARTALETVLRRAVGMDLG